MKQVLILVFLVCNIKMFAQAGVYVNEPLLNDGTKIKWTLSLNTDGTFLYHFLRDLSAISKPNIEENYYGKGTWQTDGKVIVLLSKETEDLNEQYTINLNNSKARYITKSPRDKSNKGVKTALLFYESEIIKGLELIKE